MRMGGFSRLTRRRVPPVTHTDALFAGQSHSIPDNLVALCWASAEHGIARTQNASSAIRVASLNGKSTGALQPSQFLEPRLCANRRNMIGADQSACCGEL